MSSLTATPLYLLNADAAFLRKDTASVRRILTRMQSTRAAFALPDVTIDALYPEAWLLAAIGDTIGAAAVVTLWSDADAFLQPIVAQMRRLARQVTANTPS